jgi:molybdopterin-containing oxidoreductase family iron-sulfur binding subunit
MTSMSDSFIPLAELSRRATGGAGRRYWKSLEELAASPAFDDWLGREFPEQASEWSDPTGRRRFLTLMGASMAFAGATGCTRQPKETIVPYVKQPEQLVPGKPQFYATSLTREGYANGVLVESHLGRPTKIEGNAEHPASLGATDVFGQAEVLQLYDPDRAQAVTERGEIRSWSALWAVLTPALEAQRPLGGEGLRILIEPTTSPTLAAELARVRAAFPKARLHQWQSAGRDSVLAGTQLAFGAPRETHYELENADVILSLDADFVSEGPGHLRHIRGFARRRDPDDAGGMNRLYVVESHVTSTGGSADHRLPLRASQIEGFARGVAAGLGLPVAGGAAGPHGEWVAALVEDLKASPGRSVVLVGDHQPAAVHALGHAINEALGAFGKTAFLTEPVLVDSEDPNASLMELTADMGAGRVDLLLVLGGNPVYTAPADIDFRGALAHVPLRVHLGLHRDETSQYCHWHLPQAHALETWGDARAYDGTVTIQQPLIAPLYAGRSVLEVLAGIRGERNRSGYDSVREYWRDRLPGDFETLWRRALHDGIVRNTALPPLSERVQLGEWATWESSPPESGLELAFRRDPRLGDGRFANNGWMQELPHPVTKVTWDNPAIIAPALAERLGIAPPEVTSRGHIVQVVELNYKGRTLRAPVWISPGQPDGSVTVSLGGGRTQAGHVGNGVGIDAYALRTSDAPAFGNGLEIRATGQTQLIACTQDHWTIDREAASHERHLVRSATLEEYKADSHMFEKMGHEPGPELTMHPPFQYPEGEPYRGAWGMAIDLNKCVGCNACVVACQAENNIPVVGKEEVGRGREMQWIRVDRYYHGGLDNPEAVNQPVMCMHCENAPCEVVCPVAATVHSDEGLNDMVYNRCVGTRYCSNNCPYKVRRFNFFLYQDWETPQFALQRNPDVTVRSRGVMEKCTYCVQRINQARNEAKNAGQPLRDGDIQTACQQSCPAEAITFGDVNDPRSRVARLKANPRDYGLLAETGTRPRTSYLSAVKNPNPRLRHG